MIPGLRYNSAVAQIYTLVNDIEQAQKSAKIGTDTLNDAMAMTIQMIAPMMPHLAEECWQEMGCDDLVSEQAWPQYSDALATDDVITMPIQINGKKRADLEVSPDASKEEIEAATLQLDVVIRHLDGKTPKKVIVVPKRIVNVVI